MNLIVPPSEYDRTFYVSDALFIAGGISGCPDWQTDLIGMLADLPITILNPRRPVYDANDTDAARAQITWEFNHLRLSKGVSFWFPKETLCPITLLEFGRWSNRLKNIFVGCHPDYQRRVDIEIQLELARPDLKVSYSLEDLAKDIRTNFR